MNSAQTIYLISGPLGVGKTTVSKALAAKLGYEYLDGDALFAPIRAVEGIEWEAKLKRAWHRILTVTRGLLINERSVVIDFVVEDELEWIVQELSNLEVHLKYVVLVASEETLKRRLEKRGEGQYWGRSVQILKKLTSDARNKRHIVDTEHKSVEEVVGKIISL